MKIPALAIARLAVHGIDAGYVLTGQRSAGRGAEESPPAHTEAEAEEAEDAEFLLVPRYDVTASAGGGSVAENASEIGRFAFRKDWLRRQGLSGVDLRLFQAKGDSMEKGAAGIHDGDWLLVAFDINDIQEDGVYIVSLDDLLMVKRVQSDLKGGFLVLSDNPDYRIIEVPVGQLDALRVAGKVERIFRVDRP